MMIETVGGRRMLLLLQAEREDASAAVVVIATRLALRDSRQYLNPEEEKAPAIKKVCRSGTVAAGPPKQRQ